MKASASLVPDADPGPLTSKREQDHPSIGCHVIQAHLTTTSTPTHTTASFHPTLATGRGIVVPSALPDG